MELPRGRRDVSLRGWRAEPATWNHIVDDETSAFEGGALNRGRGKDQWKLSPQAQLPLAFGLSIVKPCFAMVSAKSIVAPSRYGELIRSTTPSTPSKSRSRSPSSTRSSK